MESKEERYRSLRGPVRIIGLTLPAAGVALALSFVFHFTFFGRIMPEQGYLGLLLALFLPAVFLHIPGSKNAPRDKVPWYDLLAALLSLAGPLYKFILAEEIPISGLSMLVPTEALVVGVITWVLLIEAARRSIGTIFCLLVAFFSVYPTLLAPVMPGFLQSGYIPFNQVIGYYFIGPSGIYGLVTKMTGCLVLGYMTFGVVLQVTGGGQFFINLANSLLGRVRGGPAKVSILSSAFFATLSGSVLSNVVTTGSVTIPTMKKAGYPAHYAAAVEACASTGGTITPPVMGAAAFIIAVFLDIPYVMVCLAAAVPAFLYFFTLFLQTDFFAVKHGLKGLPQAEIPQLTETLKKGWPFVFSILVLIFALLYLRLEREAPFFAMAFLFAAAIFNKENRLNRQRSIQFLQGLARVLVSLFATVVPLGMVIGCVDLTGIGIAFSSWIKSLVGANLFFLLPVAGLASFVLGMGLTVTACYVFLAVLIGPALVMLGVYPLAAHLFILYWGLASFITPPVALGAYAAAPIAGAPPVRVGFQSMRLGMVLFIVPFVFCFNPALVLHGSAGDIMLAIGSTVVGMFFIVEGIERYVLGAGKVSWPAGVLLILPGVALLSPIWQLQGIGIVAGVAETLLIILLRKRLPSRVQRMANLLGNRRSKSEY